MSTSDYLFIEGLEEVCRVGTTVEERSIPQTIRLSLKLYFPLLEAGTRDDLEVSVDYAEVCARIRSLLTSREFVLIEAVAEAAGQIALGFGRVESVRVNAEKRVLPGVRAVGAEIWRQRVTR